MGKNRQVTHAERATQTTSADKELYGTFICVILTGDLLTVDIPDFLARACGPYNILRAIM